MKTMMMPTMTMVMIVMTRLPVLLIRIPSTPTATELLTVSITNRGILKFHPTLPLMGTTLHLLLTITVRAITVCMGFIFFKAMPVARNEIFVSLSRFSVPSTKFIKVI